MGASCSRGTPSTAMDSIATSDETIKNLEKREEYLKRKIAAEFADAKKFHAAGKAGEKQKQQCLKKKRMYEKELTTVETMKSNLENQKSAIQSTNRNIATTTQVNTNLKALRVQIKTMGGAGKVDEMMDEADEALAEVREIDEAMNRQLGGIEVDPDELNAEFEDALNAEFDEGQMEKKLAADLSKVDLGRAVVMPSAPISLPAAEMSSAPISLPAAGTKKIMTDEERELAELEAAMAE